ncbi:ImmA/IrrE family metallo-endopeptidase [Sediminibacter sp. Hel_I_10]|uniref:ImmA/IrrE family metallo-endopeptidase n=1 Tax=Sediminibacter sp. Hel_I_10 TaxID=1392490 RepID=UPI0006908BD5|nr:hypothetical protein [Sediminibacter sp. Hel_I_10]
MKKNKNQKIKTADLKKYFISESSLISSDLNTAQSILIENGYDIEELENEALEFISNIDLTQSSKIEIKFTWKELFKKLSKNGLPSQLIKNKIIPNYPSSNTGSTEDLELTIDCLSQIFGFSRESLINDEVLSISTAPMRQAFFKKPINTNIHQINAYSHYAQFIAKTVSVGCKDIIIKEYPKDIKEFKAIITNKEGDFDIESILKAVWDLGICVVPLNDSGVFHGASWNIEERHIIVLKQKTDSHAKWIFDLLHELYHVFVHLEDSNSSVIEEQEISPLQANDSIEEREANAFANGIIFGNKAEELAQKCVDNANGRIQGLKQSVLRVAEEENIRPDFLANYIAYRLNIEGDNWWGTANSLQITKPLPYKIVKDQLIDKINYNHLNKLERHMLSKAINTI